MFDAALNERQSRIDRVLVVALVGLMLLGAAFVYSATMVSESARLRLVPPELVPADRLVPARDWRGGGYLLRGLSYPGPLVHGCLLGRGANVGRSVALRLGAVRGAALV